MNKRLFAHSRDEAVRAAFYKVLRGQTVGEAFEELAKAPAPRFYVSFEEARRNVSRISRGLHPQRANANRIEMYKELCRRWKLTRAKGFEVLAAIIQEPAPSFYLSIGRLKSIVYRTR